MQARYPLLIITVLSLARPAAAQTGAAWLGYPSSARSVAEAGGLGVMSDGVHGLGLNPAGLASGPKNGELAISHSSWAADIKAEHLAGAFKAGDTWAALGGSWVDFGSVQGYRYDAALGNVPEGTLRPSAGALGLSLARALGRHMEAGVTAQWLMQDLTGRGMSNAAAVDMGMRAQLGWGMHAALSLVHLGSALDGSDLPTAGRLGLAYQPVGSPIELGIEGIRAMQGDTQDIAAAARLHLGSALVARGGWLGRSGQAMSPSLGASFSAGAWTLDYAYRGQEGLGATHHLGVQFTW